MLTHYTRTPEAVENILKFGFAWIANRRRLTKLLIPAHDFSRREPQQFGMVSFTDLQPSESAAHRRVFGEFGIVVSDGWARTNNVQRVIYVDDGGPITAALQTVFAAGYTDIVKKIKYPNDGAWRMCYENKHAASAIAGSMLWAQVLQLWEYLEPATSAAQREWRIVNPSPNYSVSENTNQAIAQVSPPQNWATILNVVTISRSEVLGLVCRHRDSGSLTAKLPAAYRDIRISEI